MNHVSLPAAAGIGLRHPHVNEILFTKPEIPYLEVLADNYLSEGGMHLKQLEQLRESYPLSFHCVGMSLGSVDPVNKTYLNKLAELINRYDACAISDHLSWVGFGGQYFHDLLPMPYTEEAINHLCSKIGEVQDILKTPLILENVSSYISFNESEMSEAEFISEISKRSGCYLLLDINNIYVSAKNHRFEAMNYLNAIPSDRVTQFHLAGHEQRDGYLLDTHSQTVCDDVWTLYKHSVERFGIKPTLIEWDNQIPPLAALLAEAEKAQLTLDSVADQTHPRKNTGSNNQAIAC